MKTKRALSIVARAACVLLCLVLFSAHLCSGMFARYTNKGEGASSARVAALNVYLTPENEEVEVTSTGDASYPFSVTNASDVAVSYDIVIVFKGQRSMYNTYGADAMKRVISDVAIGDIEGTVSNDGKVYTLSDVGVLAPGDTSDTYDLSYKIHVLAQNNSSLSTSYAASVYYLDFDLYAKVKQID